MFCRQSNYLNGLQKIPKLNCKLINHPDCSFLTSSVEFYAGRSKLEGSGEICNIGYYAMQSFNHFIRNGTCSPAPQDPSIDKMNGFNI